MKPKAEILAIGTELVSGQKVDTNSAWICSRLETLGIEVRFITVLGDDHAENREAFETAVRRSPLVFSTGGLGPTQDDLTREIVAEVAGAPLVEDAESVRELVAFFARHHISMPERNRVQALIPQGGSALLNRSGTAPGVWMPIGDSIVACLPGVPSEMKIMFNEQVMPRLWGLSFGRVIAQRKINLFGLGESEIEAKALDLTARGRTPEVGITAHHSVISFRIRSEGADEADARAAMEPTVELIKERFGDLIFGEEDSDLQHAVFELLQKTNAKIATAESCTAGMIASWLGDIPGISDFFLGGVVSYSNQAKMDLLDVPAETLEQYGAVSPQTAIAMAQGARLRLKADLAVSVTGVAGPGGGSIEKPVGLVYLGLASEQGAASKKLMLGSNRSRDLIRDRSARRALDWLRLHLLRNADFRTPPIGD